MTILDSKNYAAEVENYDGLVVIDLYADWCGPCRMLAPTVEALEDEYPDVKFCKTNVDDNPELAAKFGVESIPFIAFVKDGALVDRSIGFVPKERLAAILEAHR